MFGVGARALYIGAGLRRVALIRPLLKMLGLSAGEAKVTEIDIDRLTYAVGDIHGRADLLDRMVDQIGENAAGQGESNPRLIFLGDYIDRGPDGYAVLNRLGGLAAETGWEVIGLRGNHEIMLQDFLADPEAAAPRWFRNGGLETLLSCQVGGVVPSSSGEAVTIARDRLSEALETATDWLADLKSCHQVCNVIFTHAGADPALPIAEQTERALAWGVPSFLETAREDDLWVVHGHYIYEVPEIAQRRIAVDTGAYYSGKLTAARIAPGEVTFLST